MSHFVNSLVALGSQDFIVFLPLTESIAVDGIHCLSSFSGGVSLSLNGLEV